MQLKINKEMLLRHRFWIMIGVAMLLSLVGIFYLQFAADADEAKSDLAKKLKQGKDTKALHSAATAEIQAKHAKEAADLENGIWKAAFETQKDEFRWAKEVEDKFSFYDGLFATSVKLDKAPASEKEWLDPPNGVVGKLLSVEGNFAFAIKTRDQATKKFMSTPSIAFVQVVGEKAPLPFADMRHHIGKLVTLTYQRGRYFGDPLTRGEVEEFNRSYNKQCHDILQSVDPLTEKGGIVQLKDWLYRQDVLPTIPSNDPQKPGNEPPFFRYVTQEFDAGREIFKEVWIAQENLWIQKEIYRLIAEANRSISLFKLKDVDKATQVHTFENPTFEVRLSLDKDKGNALTFVIKNRTNRRQKLDLDFRIWFNGKDAPPEKISITGVPLMPAGHAQGLDLFKHQETAAPSEVRKGIFGLEQVLNYDTAAVKRIDLITIGSNEDKLGYSHAHRTFPDGLRALDEPKPMEKKFDPAAGAGGANDPIEMMKRAAAQLGGPGPVNEKMLEYGLWTKRYLELPDQTRRIPVTISLIVDQDHVDRVLGQFNNSKLRLLLSQVLLNQYTGSLAPPAVEAKDGPKGLAFPFGGGRPPNQAPQQPGAGGGGGAALETNMELVMYGVMTLYQRFPPRPPVVVEKKL